MPKIFYFVVVFAFFLAKNGVTITPSDDFSTVNKSSSIKTTDNFSVEEIRLVSRFANNSYNHPEGKEDLKKFRQKGWVYHHFKGKSFLGEPYTAGFVAFSPSRTNEKPKIFIAFRGTQTLSDIATDLSYSAKTYHPFRRPGNIHSGFLSIFESMIQQIKIIIIHHCLIHKKQVSDFSIITTGHSLGGALATIMGFYFISDQDFGTLNNDNAPNNSVRTVTFGSPRVGDYLFSKEYDQFFGKHNHLRFTSLGDICPSLPPESWGYYHIGTEINLNDHKQAPKNSIFSYFSKKIIETSLKNHSLVTYIEAVNHYLKKMSLKNSLIVS